MITIRNLSKAFGRFLVIDKLSLEFADSSITSILAPSGAGKTTLLRIVSGLERPSSGSVTMDGKEIAKPSSEIGFMFQENSTFPWLTVRENIRFGLNLKANKSKRISCVSEDEILTELNLEGLLDLYPNQLSGGQRQRVVIARTLLLRPKVVLCDEPFSALDEPTRQSLRELLLDVHRHYLPTIVFITHSIEEAVFLGSNLIVCSGPPLNVLHTMDLEFNHARDASLLDTDSFLKAKTKVRSKLSKPLVN